MSCRNAILMASHLAPKFLPSSLSLEFQPAA